jgi:hypothetical protein
LSRADAALLARDDDDPLLLDEEDGFELDPPKSIVPRGRGGL